MNKRILSFLLTLCMLVSMLSGMVLPAGAEEIPYARDLEQYPDATVFQVAEQADLEAMATAVNAGNTMEGITFLQTADITMTGEHTPIGYNHGNTGSPTWGKPFMGTYDGQRHTISNLIVNLPSQNGVGLFGACYGATLKNIGIESGTITGKDRTGGIAGYADACFILNCYNKAAIVKPGTSNNNGHGGIAGVARSNAVISGCFNLGSVTGYKAVGGITGWGAGNLTVRNCYSGGTLSGSTSKTSYVQVIARLNTTLDYSSNYYLASIGGSNAYGSVKLSEPDNARMAYIMNRSEGEDSGAFTVDSEGDIVFASEDNGPVFILTVAAYTNGAELFEDVSYRSGAEGFTVPAQYCGYDVVSAVADGVSYAVGDTVPTAGDIRVELAVEGSFPSVAKTDEYPDDRVYTISTAEEFASMADFVSQGHTYEGKAVLVVEDLDFSGYETWTPIGVLGTVSSGNASDDSIGFMGRLNGQYHHFKNINMTFDGAWKSLFAYLEGAVIENIILDEGTMTSNGTKLAVIGSLVRNTTIRNIESHISLYSTSASGSINLGIASLSRASRYEAVVNYGEMGLAESESAQENGGIVGYGYSSCELTDCYMAGTVNGSTHAKIARSGGTLTNCYYLNDADTGSMSREDFLSGLAAWNMNTLSGTRENRGEWSIGENGPVLDPRNGAYALSGTMVDQDGVELGELSVFYNEGQTVTVSDIPGYTFTRALLDGSVLEQGWSMPARDCGGVRFHFDNNVYSIRYELSGGSFLEEPVRTHVSGHAQTLPTAGALQRRGYGFTGWYDNPELEGEPVQAVAPDEYSDVTYYASWGQQIPIATAQQLASIKDFSASYILVADIDMTGVDFTPIGSRLEPFTGSFDGNGYVISNLVVESNNSYQGLFGYNAGVISNVTLDDTCSISGSAYTGSIAGYNAGTIVNCITEAKVTCSEPEITSYKVMSQNLCIWGSGDFSVANRQPRMLERIYSNDPDVIAFQEGSKSWVNYLEANLEGYSLIYKNRGTSSFEAVPVAYKTSKFDLVESGHFWLSETPEVKSVGWDASMYRICTYVVLRDRSNGEMISMFNVHLDHKGPESRIQSGALIRSRINALMERYEGIMLFAAGDYNCNESSDGYKALTAEPMADARYIASETTDMNTHSSTTTEDWVNQTSSRIDFISTYEPAVEVDKFEVLAECVNGTRLSDHNGLLATFHSKDGIALGGAIGGNAGTAQRIISTAEVTGGEENGALIGRNYDAVQDLYYADSGIPAVGSGDDSGCEARSAFTAQQVWEINRRAGCSAFTVFDEAPIVVGGRDFAVPVRLLVNDEPIFALSGDTLALDVSDYTEPVCLLNGELLDGTVLTVPNEDSVVRITEGLEPLKEEAKAELQAYRDTFDNENYHDEQVAQLDEAVDTGCEAIDGAESYEALQAALAGAKAAMDDVLTRFEADMSEHMAALRRAQAAAEAAQAAAEAAEAAAETAAASAAEDMTAAEAAAQAAELAQAQAQAAAEAAEAAKNAAEEANAEAAESAAEAAEAAAGAAEAAASAAASAADAQAAQAAAEAARAAAEEAAQAASEDMTAADLAGEAAELAKAQAENAASAAETAKNAAEAAASAAENAETGAAQAAADAAAEAAQAAASASAAAGSAESAAQAAKDAQTAQTAAEAARAAAEEAAASAAEDMTGAETARAAAELARTQAEAAMDAARKTQAAAEEAAEAAQAADAGAAEKAAAAAASAREAAASATAAADSARQAADAAKTAQQALKAAEDARKKAEDAAREAEEEANRIAREAALNLRKSEAVAELSVYAQNLQDGAAEENFAGLTEASRAGRQALLAAQTLEELEGALAEAKAALDAVAAIRCAAEEFSDVDRDAWYHEAIDFVLNSGVMSGNGDGTFTPEAPLNRAMLVQILYNLEGRPETETDKTFTDVSEDDWYCSAVLWAAENSIVLGYDNGAFGAGDNVTREQMVTILWRYAGEPGSGQEMVFADADSISDWAVDAVLWAYESGIVRGVGEGLFDPAGPSQRAAAAQVMMNYYTK